MERLCVDCKHFDTGSHYRGVHNCCRALAGKANPMNGRDIDDISADLMRMTLCGWSDPKFWEPKPRASAE